MPEKFDGGSLEIRQLTSLSNLLVLRNGGQAKPASLDREYPDQDSHDNHDDGSIDTSNPQIVSDSNNDSLKRAFLDCLAELATNTKARGSVACTAMKEAEESVVIWVARNDGFQGNQKPWFNRLQEILCGISGDKENQMLDEELWQHILAYHKKYLESNYIPALRASLKGCEAWEDQLDTGDDANLISALQELKDLRKLIFDRNERSVDKYDKLATKSCELRRFKALEKLLQISPDSTAQTRTLWGHIRAVGNLRLTFEKFKKTALELPSFGKVTINLVPRGTSQQDPFRHIFKFSHAINLLRLPLSTSTIQNVTDQAWSITKAEQEFVKLQKQKLDIHAEVQMILFLSREEPFPDLFMYFGCSKYSCFMCSHFLKAYGKFGTRGCHGRVFKSWAVPEATGLASGQEERIGKALTQVQKILKKELKSKVNRDILDQQEKSETAAEELAKQAELDKEKFEAQQEKAAYKMAKQSLDESKRHDTAESLIESIVENELPQHEDVLMNFGFHYFPSYSDRWKLFSVYRGLCESEEITAEVLRQWQAEGSMFTNIKDHFEQMPEDRRVGYFDWFLNHPNMFDEKISAEQAAERVVETFFDEAQLFLDEEDRDTDPSDLEPELKKEAFLFLALTLHMSVPNPVQEAYYNFGFCTCSTVEEEQALGGLYQQLLLGRILYSGKEIMATSSSDSQTATFTEFWKAYDAGTLIPLMDSKGLRESRLEFPYLEAFLSCPSTEPRPSLTTTVKYDYGFANCQTPDETRDLLGIYDDLLRKVGPLEIHSACIEGKLFELAKSVGSAEDDEERLMRNMYPIPVESN